MRVPEAALFALRADFGPVFSQGRRAIAGGRRMGRFEGMRPSIPCDPNIAVHSGQPQGSPSGFIAFALCGKALNRVLEGSRVFGGADYWECATMYSTTVFSSSSLALVPPRAGMPPRPLMATFMSSSMPVAMRGAQASLSPTLGAPPAPVP